MPAVYFIRDNSLAARALECQVQVLDGVIGQRRALGFFVANLGSIIHLLLVIAVIALVYNLFVSSRGRASKSASTVTEIGGVGAAAGPVLLRWAVGRSGLVQLRPVLPLDMVDNSAGLLERAPVRAGRTPARGSRPPIRRGHAVILVATLPIVG